MNIINGPVDCSPSDVGYDPSRVDAVNAFFTRMIENKILYGVSYRMARFGKAFASVAIGSRHYKDPDALMQPDSVFGVASITKAFTAVAIQILVEDGLLAIEDKTAKYLPQFDGEPYDDITLYHLLTHTSGLYSEGSIPDKHHIDAFEHIEHQFGKDGLDADWIAAGLRGGMRRKPGEEWQYCSFGMMVLGAVIEKVSGLKAEAFIGERILKPLGMSDSGFDLTPEMAKRASIFNERSEEWIGKILRGEPLSDNIWDALPGTAGGLISTTADLLRFGVMLQQWGQYGDTRILGRKAIESMVTQRLRGVPDYCWGANAPDRHYGLGFDMRRIIGTLSSPGTYFHEGSGHCVLIVDPVEELVVACSYPFVDGVWNGDCNNRLYNVIWSGLI